MDENIFGGASINPEEPDQNENEINGAEIPEEAVEVTAPEAAGDDNTPDADDDSSENNDSYMDLTGDFSEDDNASAQTHQGYNPFYGQGNPYGAQPPYQGYQPQGNMPPFGYSPYGVNNGNGFGQPPQGNVPPVVPTVKDGKKKKNSGLKVFIGIIIAIVAVTVFLMIGLFTGNVIADSGKESTSQIQNVEDISVSDSSNVMGDAVTVARVAKPFNVGILVYSKNQLYTEGSGVILKEDTDGKYTYIVTCAHVVNYSGVALSVLLEDGTEYPADLVGIDSRTDLAVVRIEANGLPKAEIADSDQLLVGQTIYAIGNPGGSEFFGSVTEGIVSAIGRPVSSGTGYEMECIQHTSAINPGNSGGALVNGQGQLVGINSMKIASTEYEGMGFAVPSSVMVSVFNSIIENGYVAGRAKLGIQYATPSNYSQTYAMYVQMKGLPLGTIVIASVSEDSDLYGQDVKEGDMIVAVNGQEMTYSDMLADMIEDMSAGDTLTLTIVRVNTEDWSQTERDITVKLVEDMGTSGAQVPSTNEGSGSSSGSEGYPDWYEFFKDYYGE